MTTATVSLLGYKPVTRKIKAYNRTGTALAAGDVCALDLALGSTEATTNSTFQTSDSGWANLVDPNATTVLGGIHVVATEAIADDAAGIVLVEGIIDAFVIRATGNIAAGDALVAAASNNLDGVTAAGEQKIAIALEAQTTPTSRTLSSVYFRGDAGFGAA